MSQPAALQPSSRPDPESSAQSSRPASMTAAVMEHVRLSVASGVMKPGELYSVYQLAEQLGFSRSPVREGLLRLEEAGLIRFEKNRGFRIVEISAEDVAEIFAIRMALEPQAAFKAAVHGTVAQRDLALLRARMVSAAGRGAEQVFFELDTQLHDLIMNGSGLPRSRQIVESLRSATRILGVTTTSKRTYQDIIEEHDPIIQAIAAGDGPAAAEGMRRHLAATGLLIVQTALESTDRTDDPRQIWDSYMSVSGLS